MENPDEILNKLIERSQYFEKLENNPTFLFQEGSKLDKNYLETLKAQVMGNGQFRPVKMLRLEIINILLEGSPLSEEVIEERKNAILKRNAEEFEGYNEEFLNGLKSYPSKNFFKAWKSAFSLLYPMFYSGTIREETTDWLEELGRGLISETSLPDYKYHWVDFQGAQNFGSSFCWIALFPKKRVSHRKSYQLFLRILPTGLEAGMKAGHDIYDPEKEIIEKIENWDSLFKVFKKFTVAVVEANDTLINHWKWAPGPKGVYWDELKPLNILAVGWDDLGDLNLLNTEEIGELLEKENASGSNDVWNLENFRDAPIGDIVIANRGVQTVLAIGLIKGEYKFDPQRPYYQHTRAVEWVITEPFTFEKGIFRKDTFTPTKKWKHIRDAYLKLNPQYEQIFDNIEAGRTEPEKPAVIISPDTERNFWWLNANPKIWKITDMEAGDQQNYTTYNEKGNKRRIYKYFEEVKPGDFVVGYESSPTKQVTALLEITEGIDTDEKEGEIISFEIEELVARPIHWDELKDNPGLSKCEVFNNNQGSLFKLTREEFEIIRDLIDERNIEAEKQRKEISPKEYNLEQDEEKPFLSKEKLKEIHEALDHKKNIILQGPPGAGKTFVAKKIAWSRMGMEDESRVQLVQFHQSFSYEDFIEGIRPEKAGFKRKKGIFHNFCELAAADKSNRPWFFIIDEINRGNLSKIFGELFMLIEADKRKEKYAVPLTYSERDDAPFYIPENLFLIGTMNTADRSLALVDYALRRRFAFVDLEPCFDDPFQKFLEGKGVSPDLIHHITTSVNAINQKIMGDRNLGPGFQIGHSYFCHLPKEGDYSSWFNRVLKFEVAPLLREYWFDDLTTAADEIKKLQFEAE